jgi:hypothetical protein
MPEPTVVRLSPTDPAVASVLASVDDTSINTLIAAFFDAHRDVLSFKKTVQIEKLHLTITIEGAATQAPVLSLGPRDQGAFIRDLAAILQTPPPDDADLAGLDTTNVALVLDGLKLSFTLSGLPTYELKARAKVEGFLCTRDGHLAIQSVSGTIEHEGSSYPWLNEALDVVLEILRRLVDGYPLPHFEKLGLQIQMQSVAIAGHAIQCMLVAHPASHLVPQAPTDEQDVPEGQAVAAMQLEGTETLVDMLARAQTGSLPHYHEKSESVIEGWGIRAELLGGIQPIGITFEGAHAMARTELGFRASIGVKAACGDWVDFGVTPANVYVKLECGLETFNEGRFLALCLYPNFDMIEVDFAITFPILRILLHPIEELLAQLVRSIAGQMGKSLATIPVWIYQLPQAYEIYDAHFDFRIGSCSIREKTLYASITASPTA